MLFLNHPLKRNLELSFFTMMNHSIHISSRKPVKALFILLLLIVVCSCSSKPGMATKTANDSEAYSARILFSDSIHDFGTFPASTPLQKHTFTFVNRGAVPAVVLGVTVACRCTSVEYTRNAVRPGEKGSVTVIFDGTQASPGYFNKSVRIRINSSEVYTLRMKGRME